MPIRSLIAFIFIVFAMFAVSPASQAETNDIAAVKAMIDERGTDPLAGIWHISGRGATIAFVPEEGNRSRFSVVIVDSHDMSVKPGKQVGKAFATGVPGTYDLTLERNGLKRDARLIVTMDKDGLIRFKPYKQQRSLSLWRLVPYMFRNPVSYTNTRPENVDGAVRVYPSETAGGPVML